MPQPELIVIGGSAGALKPVLELVRALPDTLPAAVCVVIHTPPESPGRLPEIVQRATTLPCKYPNDEEIIRPGHIYLAPVDRHLLIETGRLRVTGGPRENGFRPAVDPLFRTAARAYGPQVVGVVLSGSLDDGSYGLAVIKQAGGLAIVQDPDDAVMPGMPRGALRTVEADHVAKAAELGPLIVRLCQPPVATLPTAATSPAGSHEFHPSIAGAAMPADARLPDPAERGTDLTEASPPGDLTPLTCPECGGSLWQDERAQQVRFNCHVGHAFSADSLLEYHSRAVEGAMWTALRVLEEHAALQKRMADRARHQSFLGAAEQFERRSEETRRQAQSLRGVLLSRPRQTADQVQEAAAGG
ncbi:MAG: chemotaxis protein CheB [Candidatus Saccharimonadales bacterium]